MERKSNQLTVVGAPDSFDYSNLDELLVVSSLKGVSLYSINNFESPLSELFYEHPCGLTQVKFQKKIGGVFSCLNNDNVTVFDANARVQTTNDIIGTLGRIYDHNWSPFNVDTLATCCDSGYLSLWDLRCTSSPSLQVATQKVSDKVKWCPFDSNIISICCENRYVMLWDIRVLDNVRPTCLHVIEPFYGIMDYNWDETVSSLYIGSCRGSVESWSFSSTECVLKQSVGCDLLTRYSQLLPHPSGEGVLLSNTAQKRLSVVDIHPSSTEEADVWDSSLSSGWLSSLKSHNFESQNKLIGLQWIHNDHKLLLMTENAVTHTLSFRYDSPVSVANANSAINTIKVCNLRNSRHLVGGSAGKDDFEAQVSPTPTTAAASFNANTNSGKKSVSRHGSVGNAAATARQATIKDVVGPLSFSSLLESEIGALDVAIRTGLIDGLKIDRFDQFGRRIVLDLLIPSVDPFILKNKVHDGSYSNYYRPEELHQFVIKKSSQLSHSGGGGSGGGHSSRLVSLLISFSSKLANFWSPTFLIDNKCGIDLGGDSMTAKLLNDLSSICKAFVQHSPPESTTSLTASASPMVPKGPDESSTLAASGVTINEGLLLQIARYFRKNILKQWEKKFDSDRLSVSFGSFRPNSNDNMHSGGIPSKSLVMNGGSLGQSFDNIQSSFLSSIDELAHKVPYPVSSGGVFNARGELVCFGSALLNRAGGEPFSFPRYPNSSHLNRSYAGYQLAVLTRNPLSSGALVSGNATNDAVEEIINHKHEGFEFNMSVDTTTNLHKNVDGYDDKHVANDAISNNNNGSNNEDDGDLDYQFSFDRDSRTFPKVLSGTEDLILKPTPPPSTSDLVNKDIRRNISVSSYFVADLDVKSDAPVSFSSKSNIGTPVLRFNADISIYSSILDPVRELSIQYSLGPFVHSTDSVIVGSDISSTNKVVLGEFTKRAEACRQNALVVHSISTQSRSLFQFWNLLAVALDVYTVVDTGGLIEWNSSVLGCSLLFRLVQYLWKINDLQTFAVAICVVGGSKAVSDLLSIFQRTQFLQQQQQGTANSISVDFSLVEFQKLAFEIDNILYAYAEVLRRWGNHTMATAVVKHMTMDYACLGGLGTVESVNLSTFKLSVVVYCVNCEKDIEKNDNNDYSNQYPDKLASYCQDCHNWAQYCSICQSCTRGYFAVCSLCGHGGHTAHMRLWFETCGECATGCGCRCSFVTTIKKRVTSSSGMSVQEINEDELEDFEDNDDREFEDDEDIYYRGDVIDVYGISGGGATGTGGKHDKSIPGYDTYDFNRPHHYMDLLQSNNYSYNYNNFYETMKDYPGSILEEGSGSEEEDDDT